MRNYSRLVRFEERRNLRSAVLLGLLTLGLILFFIFFGLPLMAKFAGFLADLRKTSTPVESADTTPPAPPRLDTLPEATNKLSINITGSTEPGATVILSLNTKEEEILANSEGEFTFNFELLNGENSILAKARDDAGNESQKTQTVKIIFDDEAPSLEITAPPDGASFFGSKQRQIVVEGKTEEGTSLTINDRFVLVENDGTFAFTTTLGEGENSFNLKAKDKAENLTEKTIKVSFTP
ncbi:hypothetical protein A2V56_00395 [Candidatus Woesebacteria bacterium RBG_19FT_COMBO_42_9]|uniref:Uncharacterized protein n=1 Tax=Candidatus Woesebacteria bacterium RBG_16_42_24 TaxID=1802485 RepID=A0A1F7XJC4_9BACT|nr:MAG: hypothetical protein A2V97_00220 [Candidatus Woesebacteria bacterium RBG_16_42_24]OGM17462.1 MAG: hypothetical protein A2V56_00395 [Candidatus Woesebacteria bacterium RBG_19FT_COMBO_42_9]